VAAKEISGLGAALKVKAINVEEDDTGQKT